LGEGGGDKRQDSGVRIQEKNKTDLLKPLPKVRLAWQTTEIQYGQIHFKDTPAELWLLQLDSGGR
jgi:hypothetical protein